MAPWPVLAFGTELIGGYAPFGGQLAVEPEQRPADCLVSALVGLDFEARIAAGPGVFVICRGNDAEVEASLSLAINSGCRSFISFGVAGGLAPHLRPGDWVVASSIVDAQQVRPTDQAWSRKILTMLPGAGYAPIIGVDAPVSDPKIKQSIHADTGAAAVDMESHHLARLASARGVSFAAVRVVLDPAHRAVPAAALAGIGPDGGINVAGVLRELIARPSQVSGLFRLAFDAYAARMGLVDVRRMLGPAFGLFDLPSFDRHGSGVRSALRRPSDVGVDA
jgi:hopanoid-associated phosphorylase